MNQFSRCLSNVRTALNIIVHEEQREKKDPFEPPVEWTSDRFFGTTLCIQQSFGSKQCRYQGFLKRQINLELQNKPRYPKMKVQSTRTESEYVLKIVLTSFQRMDYFSRIIGWWMTSQREKTNLHFIFKRGLVQEDLRRVIPFPVTSFHE